MGRPALMSAMGGKLTFTANIRRRPRSATAPVMNPKSAVYLTIGNKEPSAV